MKANISMIIEQNISACNELHDIYFLFFSGMVSKQEGKMAQKREMLGKKQRNG